MGAPFREVPVAKALIRVLAPAFAIALVLVLFGACQSAAPDLDARARAALAPIDGEIALDGLSRPVEVLRDTWGVPHIYAETVDDLFFAQGFVAAGDRLWQLDLWRRTAAGELSEIVGPSAVSRDTFARLLRYRGDMDAEWRSYAPDARRIVEAFVRGVNAQVARVLANPAQLPIEFQLTGVEPEPWTPEVVIGRMAGYIMTRNARTEVQRAQLARTAGLGRVAEFMPPDPPVPIELPDGLDLADITDDILAIARDATSPIRFGAEPRASGQALSSSSGLAGPHPRERQRASRERPLALPPLGWLVPSGWSIASSIGSASRIPSPEPRLNSLPADYSLIGSNNWTVTGGLTRSGKPLLANDPHRTLALPSLRYTVHLNGPGWNVIGAGEPALPGVAAGHNDAIAFGFTIVGIDQQDLYVEQLNPDDPDEYLDRGAWVPMEVERETMTVKGEAPRTVELRFTRHGPVLHVDRARNRAYALRWVGMEPGTAGYLGSLSLDVARSWPEFLKALDGWKVPSENLVYADTAGNIGWVAAGLAPVRPNWHGLLPVPGHEGRYEWDGFLPVSDLPQAFNPPAGFIATANHNILPPGYAKELGYEWGAPYRFWRLSEVLDARAAEIRAGSAAERGFTVAEFQQLQHDEVSVVARTLAGALAAAMTTAPIEDPQRREAAAMLAAWDGHLSRGSAAAALYELWLPPLARAMAGATRSEADRAIGGERLSTDELLDAIDRHDPAVAGVLTGPALDEAVAEAERLMGPDRATWAWGRIHQAVFEHPLSTTPERAAVFDLPPVARGGDGTTPNATGSGRRQTNGASYREVIDLGDWDRSTMINVPGQSGQPASPFYDNLLEIWSEGRYHPMLFTREAVEGNLAGRLVLKPKS